MYLHMTKHNWYSTLVFERLETYYCPQCGAMKQGPLNVDKDQNGGFTTWPPSGGYFLYWEIGCDPKNPVKIEDGVNDPKCFPPRD